MRFFRHGLLILLICVPLASSAKQQKFTFIHTNDMHSHLLGIFPTIDYTPRTTGDDTTKGGWARIMTVIKKTKAERNNPVIIVDAGDFLMGTLFHTICRESAAELRLMKEMGYDVITLGNHEFDFKPAGLAQILLAARSFGIGPKIVASNVAFSDTSDKDDSLEAVFKSGLVLPYTVLTRNGVRIGFFGLIGRKAAEVSPFAKPVTFLDPAVTAKDMVDLLRDREKVDMVVCLSHGGVDLKNRGKSDDAVLAKKVPGIDIIISGHTHTPLRYPLVVGSTVIVQAWSYGRWVGILDVELNGGRVTVDNYKPVVIDDSIPGDPGITNRIEGFKREVEAKVLAPMGLAFDSVVAHTDFDLTKEKEDSNLGNLIADAGRWYANKFMYDPRDPGSRVVISVESNGIIRDNVAKGKSGKIAVCDLFSAVPLGIGADGTPGYPLITAYLYAEEIKKALEVLTSVYPTKGISFYLHASGLKAEYNPYRMIFDRVTRVMIGDDENGYVPLDYSSSNKKLYRVAVNLYNANFLALVGDSTMQALRIVPKDAQGRPIRDLSSAIVDADPRKPGVQEAKQWIGLVEYVRSFKDLDGDGIPDIPERYKGTHARVAREASLNPVSLVKAGTFVTYAGVGVIVIAVSLVVLGAVFIVRKVFF